MPEPRVFVFSPDWGLPSTGPFALKLLAWLNDAGIGYEVVHEDRPDKGPLGKSPWIEHDGRRIGDSDTIIRHLAARHGLPDPTALATGSAEQARADAFRIAFEERFHQILEWELFVHPEGAKAMRAKVMSMLPPLVGPLVFRKLQRHFARQLHARGIARLPDAEIADLGRRQLDGLALCLRDGSGWLGGTRPGLPDFAVWGQVALMLCWPMSTPVAEHARSLDPLAAWHGRIMGHCFAKPARAA